ncbi:nuclear mRNA export, poly(A)+RNA binding protein [Podila epigama]|nr:nuclear mRNA export, poly(A)+RNA binding protein [Podila epigama]
MSFQRGRSSRGGGGGRGGQSDSAGVSGNLGTGLFTAAGRDRLSGGGGGNGGGSGGGPTRSSRSSRRGAHRGAASLPPRPHVGEDVDGDMKMAGEKSSNFNPYQRPSRNTRSTTSTPGARDGTIVVFVSTSTGGESLATDSGLHDFLCRKALPVKVTITNKRTNSMTGAVSFLVADIVQAKALRGLSGIRYKSQKLIIKTSEDSKIMEEGPQRPTRVVQTAGTIDAIRTFIRSRHNNGFLNLENMAQDDILRSAKIIPPGASTQRSDVGAVMMKVAAELFPDITTISFAANGLRSLSPISSVAQFFPNILNLSFKGNDIRTYKDLEYLSGAKKLPSLREIIFLDNPVRDQDIAKNKDDISYRSEITKLFPSIQYLDQQPVGPKISFGLGDLVKEDSQTSTLPAPVRGNFFDSPSTQAMALEFLTTYFELFDTNRQLLEHMYDSSATFSFSTNQTISPAQKSKGKGGDNWSEYTADTRNLSRLKDLGERTKRLHVGNVAIVKDGLMSFPETKHDLSDASKFCIDAWQTGNLLPAVCIYIMVHGEYQQAASRGRPGYTKSFDRSFIIAPAPPSSVAAQRGWKCLIISDQLTVRQHNGHEAWQPEPKLKIPSAVSSAVASAFSATGGAPAVANPGAVSTASPAAAAAAAPSGQTPMQGLSPDQHAKAQELQQLTGLNYPYAVQCLAAVAWDIQAVQRPLYAARNDEVHLRLRVKLTPVHQPVRSRIHDKGHSAKRSRSSRGGQSGANNDNGGPSLSTTGAAAPNVSAFEIHVEDTDVEMKSSTGSTEKSDVNKMTVQPSENTTTSLSQLASDGSAEHGGIRRTMIRQMQLCQFGHPEPGRNIVVRSAILVKIHGDAFGFLSLLGYSFEDEYVRTGYSFMYGNLCRISLFRKYKLSKLHDPFSRIVPPQMETSDPGAEFPWMVEITSAFVSQENVNTMSDEINAVKNMLAGSVIY